jgi:hypothetical protein
MVLFLVIISGEVNLASKLIYGSRSYGRDRRRLEPRSSVLIGFV